MGHANKLTDLRDQVADKLPDVKLPDVKLPDVKLPDVDDVTHLRDQVLAAVAEKLPDDVADRLPVKKRRSALGTVRNVVAVTLLAAVVGAVVAYVRAQLADEPQKSQSEPQ